jgi:hypothetical protein
MLEITDLFHLRDIPIADAVQAGASVLGFVLVIIQLKQIKRTIQRETHSTLYSHYVEVTKLLTLKPKLRPYFYEKKALDSNDAELLSDINMMSETIASLLEHCVLQKCNLPGNSWKTCWSPYVEERYRQSPVLQNWIHENEAWYATPLTDFLAKLPLRRRP